MAHKHSDLAVKFSSSFLGVFLSLTPSPCRPLMKKPSLTAGLLMFGSPGMTLPPSLFELPPSHKATADKMVDKQQNFFTHSFRFCKVPLRENHPKGEWVFLCINKRHEMHGIIVKIET